MLLVYLIVPNPHISHLTVLQHYFKFVVFRIMSHCISHCKIIVNKKIEYMMTLVYVGDTVPAKNNN